MKQWKEIRITYWINVKKKKSVKTTTDGNLLTDRTIPSTTPQSEKKKRFVSSNTRTWKRIKRRNKKDQTWEKDDLERDTFSLTLV